MLHWNIPKWHFVFINVDIIGCLPHYKLITRVEPTKVHLLSNICVIKCVLSDGLYRVAKVAHFCKIHADEATPCSHLYQAFIYIKRTRFFLSWHRKFHMNWISFKKYPEKTTVLFIGEDSKGTHIQSCSVRLKEANMCAVSIWCCRVIMRKVCSLSLTRNMLGDGHAPYSL